LSHARIERRQRVRMKPEDLKFLVRLSEILNLK